LNYFVPASADVPIGANPKAEFWDSNVCIEDQPAVWITADTQDQRLISDMLADLTMSEISTL